MADFRFNTNYKEIQQQTNHLAKFAKLIEKEVVRKNYRIDEYPIKISSPVCLGLFLFTSSMFLTVMLRKLFCSIESYATLFTSQRPTSTCTIWPRRS
jgi:hypothetical protein